MKSIGDSINPSKYKKRPKYTVMLHEVRDTFELSANTYLVIDSIHKLSTSDPQFPFCVMSKAALGDFARVTERTVFRSLKEAEEKGLIERHDHGVRTTEKWINAVEIYELKGGE